MDDNNEPSNVRQRRSLLTRSQSLSLPPILNPFCFNQELTKKQKLQIALMSVTVAPVRLVSICLVLCLTWLLAMMSPLRSEKNNYLTPLTPWQRFIHYMLIRLGRFAFFIAGFHYVEIRGRPASPSEARILVAAPHSTICDAIVFFVRPNPSPVAKAETTDIPLFGRLMPYTNPILVQREDGQSRTLTTNRIKERAFADESSEPLPPMILFPEGTCTNGNCLINFKAGAFIPGAPVQPVLLRWPNKFDTLTWTWQGPSAYKLFWQTLCQFNNRVCIEYLPPYYPSEAEKNDPKLFARNVRSVMAESLKVPMTDHSFEDCRLMIFAKKARLPMAAGIVEFSKISRRLSMDFSQITQEFQHFTSICHSTYGRINIEEFANHLSLPISDALVNMFDMYDRDNSGTIDFREYLIGLALIAHPSNTEDTIKMAFEMFDVNKKGYLESDDFFKVLSAAFSVDRQQSDKLFSEADSQNTGKLTYDEFYAYSKSRPEYARLFQIYTKFYMETRANAEQDCRSGPY